MKIFAERLRELRTENGMSMKQLAKALNTTDAAISNWENNINEPKITYLKVILFIQIMEQNYTKHALEELKTQMLTSSGQQI